MSKLFGELNLRDNVSRNGFSLNHDCKFSAKVGELLPIFHCDVLPGDKFRCRVSNFTRTAPVQTAAYTVIKEYFDWFFIPYRIIQKDLPHILAEDTRNPVSASNLYSSKKIGSNVPMMYLSTLYGTSQIDGAVGRLTNELNQFFFNRGFLSAKLLSYLGYGNLTIAQLQKIENAEYVNIGEIFNADYAVSLLPLACYQSIYYNWFRNTQWEENQPQNYNFDWMTAGNYVLSPDFEGQASYWKNSTLFDLQYANYPKDLYFGVLPNSQFGEESMVESFGQQYIRQSRTEYVQAGNDSVAVGNAYTYEVDGQQKEGNFIQRSDGNVLDAGSPLYVRNDVNLDVQLRSTFSILELRKQEVLQKYKEILGTGENNYRSILEKIFNVDVSDKLLNIPYYLGGSTNVIKISEVENQNLADDNQAILRGKGVGSSDGDMVEFSNLDEYGCLMCIYHAQPIIDYRLNNLHFDVTKVHTDDFAKPIFDSLGMVPLPMSHVDISKELEISENPYLGYTVRNYEYKTAIDRSLGAFREGDLTSWYSPIDFDYLQSYWQGSTASGLDGINYTFFKVNPHLVDDIFGFNAADHVDTDVLWIKASFDISTVRPLSRYGVPYAK